jgi:hypothetical protein
LGNARPRWDKNTALATAIEDLELFGDAMHAELGDEYFMYVRSNVAVRNAADMFPKTEEWKVKAHELIAKRRQYNVSAEESVHDEAAPEQ